MKRICVLTDNIFKENNIPLSLKIDYENSRPLRDMKVAKNCFNLCNHINYLISDMHFSYQSHEQ